MAHIVQLQVNPNHTQTDSQVVSFFWTEELKPAAQEMLAMTQIWLVSFSGRFAELDGLIHSLSCNLPPNQEIIHKKTKKTKTS